MSWILVVIAAELLWLVRLTIKGRVTMSDALNELKSKMDVLEQKNDEVITLLVEIAAALRNQPNLTAELQALSARADAQIAENQAALDSNRDVDPTP